MGAEKSTLPSELRLGIQAAVRLSSMRFRRETRELD